MPRQACNSRPKHFRIDGKLTTALPLQNASYHSFQSRRPSELGRIAPHTRNTSCPTMVVGGGTLSSMTMSTATSLSNSSSRSGQQVTEDVHPLRPGVADCDYYIKCGRCNYGERCKYNHPPRTDELLQVLTRKECYDFLKGYCQYGTKCKYLHPERPLLRMSSSPADSDPCAVLKSKSPGVARSARSLVDHNGDQIGASTYIPGVGDPSVDKRSYGFSSNDGSPGMTGAMAAEHLPFCRRQETATSAPPMWPAPPTAVKEEPHLATEEMYAALPQLELRWYDDLYSPGQEVVMGELEDSLNSCAFSALSSQDSAGCTSPVAIGHTAVEVGGVGCSMADWCDELVGSTRCVTGDVLTPYCIGPFTSLLAMPMLNRDADPMVVTPSSPWSRIGVQNGCPYGNIGERRF